MTADDFFSETCKSKDNGTSFKVLKGGSLTYNFKYREKYFSKIKAK